MKNVRFSPFISIFLLSSFKGNIIKSKTKSQQNYNKLVPRHVVQIYLKQRDIHAILLFEFGTICKKLLDSRSTCSQTMLHQRPFFSQILTEFKRMRGISWILSGQFPNRFLPLFLLLIQGLKPLSKLECILAT